MKLDLHLHTNASDGALSSGQLIDLLAAQGFAWCAITDHDTTLGVESARERGRARGVGVIPGVELSVGDQVEIHILGYGLRVTRELEEELTRLRAQREQRLDEMVKRLNAAGVPVEAGKVRALAGGTVGRAHVARVLVEMGYAASVGEAFKKYLLPGRVGYVKREKLSAARAIELIRAAGGVAVLAHPGIIADDEATLPSRVRALCARGLSGLEVYHPRHTPAQIRRLDALARSLGLIVTGGSDFHGLPGQNAPGAGMALWTQKQTDFFMLIEQISFEM